MTFNLTRRDILAGLLVSIAAPAIIRTPWMLMPIRARLGPGVYDLVPNPTAEGFADFVRRSDTSKFKKPNGSRRPLTIAELDEVPPLSGDPSKMMVNLSPQGMSEIAERIRADTQGKQDAAVREILALRKDASEAL